MEKPHKYACNKHKPFELIHKFSLKKIKLLWLQVLFNCFRLFCRSKFESKIFSRLPKYQRSDLKKKWSLNSDQSENKTTVKRLNYYCFDAPLMCSSLRWYDVQSIKGHMFNIIRFINILLKHLNINIQTMLPCGLCSVRHQPTNFLIHFHVSLCTVYDEWKVYASGCWANEINHPSIPFNF